MLAFCVNLPSLGEAKLKHRENPRLLGTDKEHIMLQPEDPWYQVSICSTYMHILTFSYPYTV
jgi:protein transport protein SEC24